MPLSEALQRTLSESRANGSTVLSLERKEIGVDEAMDLAEELKQMPNLTSLYLSFNKIGVEGVEALAGCLPNTNITELDLAGNSIGYEGATALKEALEANCERIKNEVIAFKNKLLDKKNESKDVDPIIKKLLGKFGKHASASHIEKFLEPDEKAQVRAKIVCGKTPRIDGEDINISELLDIKSCFELAGCFTQNPTSSTEKAEHGAHAATSLTRGRGLLDDGLAEESDPLLTIEEVSHSFHTDLIGEGSESL